MKANWIPYMDPKSRCEYHPERIAVYYNYDEKWLCKECLDKEIKKHKETNDGRK